MQLRARQICTVSLYMIMVLFFFPARCRAQETSTSSTRSPGDGTEAPATGKVLKLDDAIRIALESQPRIKASEQRIRARQALLGQAKSAYYPTVSFNNAYRSSTSSGTTKTSIKAFDFVSSAASMNWTIYNFGRREGTVQEAKDNLESERFATQTTTEEVILGVKQAYYRYLQAKALVRVREDTVKDREWLVRRAKGFFEVGTRAKIEVARAEAGLFSAKANLIAAENGVKIGWAELKNTMGVNKLAVQPLAEEALLEKPLISLTEQMAIHKPVMSLAKALRAAYATRPELRDFESQRKAQDSAIATARRSHLPEILFNASYGRRQSSTRNDGGAFPLSVNWSVQVNVNIPIFSGFDTTYKVEEALRNYHEVRALEEKTRQRIALEVERSYLNLIEVGERIKATESAVRSGQENQDLANGRYRVGVGSIIEITEAQVIFTEAQTNHIQSITDYKIAEAELAKALGQGNVP